MSEEEAGEFVDQFGAGMVYERERRVTGVAALGEHGDTLLLADPPAVEALVGWLGERGHHQVLSYAGDAQRIAWLEAHGFRHRYSGFDLARGIDPPPGPTVLPAGADVAPYRRGTDDEAVHALVYVDAAWDEVPATSAIARRVAVGPRPRVQRLGRAPRRSSRGMGRRPRVPGRARAGSTGSRSPAPRAAPASGAPCCCTRSPTPASAGPPRSPSAGRARTRAPSGCTTTSGSRSRGKRLYAHVAS